ncbi:MAG: helix-turn-helix domain-containing protein [Desulfomonilaceae bacterium]
MLNLLLKPEQVAEYLGVSVKSVHQFVREGRLGCIQLSPKDRRFTEEQIQAFLQSRIIEPPKIVDKGPAESLPYRPKRGGQKSVEDVGMNLGKEIRELCR